MSDWYRGGRDDQRNYGQGGREREFGGRDRWSERNGYGTEQRSFDEGERRDYWRAEPGRGWSPRSEGYGGQGYGRQDYGGAQAYGNQGYAGATGDRQSWRGTSYGRGMGGDFGSGYGYVGGQGQGGDRFRQRRMFDEGNPYVQGVTDEGGERHFGEHRGRGPKNYTRSDERIREDVNDRLTDDGALDASEIEVQVKDCEVTLTGTVERREDKRRAEDIAEDCSGVKHVQNNLRVKPLAAQTGSQASFQTGAKPLDQQGRTAGH